MQLLPSARGAPLAGGRGGRRAVAQQQQQQQQRVVVVSHAAAPRPASALSTARSVPRPAPAVFAPSSSTSSSNGGSSLLSAFVEHESSQGWSPVEDALRTAQQSLRHEEQQQLDRLEEDWSPPTFVTATGRIVAVGDLHGDWNKALASLRAANVIDIVDGDEVVWTGGDAVVVQLGDVLDRGDNEIAIVNLLRGLDEQARQQGGAVYMLNGNHESLNVCGDFRYVTPGAMVESALFAGLDEDQLGDWELLARVRFAVYKPGGPMAMELARNPTVLVVNDTVFAHGGLLPIHVAYGVDKLNREVAAWMRAESGDDGRRAPPPLLAMGDNASIMWNRTFSRERFPTPAERTQASANLTKVLERLGARRMVVGHTPQLGGANCELDGRVWRVDVGMSAGVLNRPVQVLEIDKSPGQGETVVRVLPSQLAGTSAAWRDRLSRALGGGDAVLSRL